MSICSLEQVKALEEMGFERVVLAWRKPPFFAKTILARFSPRKKQTFSFNYYLSLAGKRLFVQN